MMHNRQFKDRDDITSNTADAEAMLVTSNILKHVSNSNHRLAKSKISALRQNNSSLLHLRFAMVFLCILSVSSGFFLVRFQIHPNNVNVNVNVESPSSHTQQQQQQEVHNQLPKWTLGVLDIHHLRVGSSESTFVIFPDGTTLLVDCGSIDVPKMTRLWDEGGYNDLKLKTPFPNGTKSTGGWVLDYMRQFWPRAEEDFETYGLDYVLLTHFHSDHMGDYPSSLSSSAIPLSKSGNFRLSGIPEIGDQIPIHTLLDRGFPDYNAPYGNIFDQEALDNYLAFTNEYGGSTNDAHLRRDESKTSTKTRTSNEKKNVMTVERFKVGSTTQIRMKHHRPTAGTPDNHPRRKQHFLVRNIKGNLDVYVPETNTVEHIGGIILEEEEHWDENELSNAIVIEYGNFRYYEGGDQESHIVRKDRDNNEHGKEEKQDGKDKDYHAFDTICPTAKAAGKVDVATLNHHGHGVNDYFLEIMDPKIYILQGWCNDQPSKESMEILSKHRKKSNTSDSIIDDDDNSLLFATDMFVDRLNSLGELADLFTSTSGHIVVRVEPMTDQDDQYYNIFVLNHERDIASSHGPFTASPKK